jgi:hypothetical protein
MVALLVLVVVQVAEEFIIQFQALTLVMLEAALLLAVLLVMTIAHSIGYMAVVTQELWESHQLAVEVVVLWLEVPVLLFLDGHNKWRLAEDLTVV